jgi:hypothetical protein
LTGFSTWGLANMLPPTKPWVTWTVSVIQFNKRNIIGIYGNFVAEKMFINYNLSLCKKHRANQSFFLFYPVQ